MTMMAMQKPVTNPDAGHWVPINSHNVWKANETASSGELQKVQKGALKEIIKIYNNDGCDAISKFELIERFETNLIAYLFLNITFMFQLNYSLNNKNNRGRGSQLL